MFLFLDCNKKPARKADIVSSPEIQNVPIGMKRSHLESSSFEQPLKTPFGTALASMLSNSFVCLFGSSETMHVFVRRV